jgi:hypothetical protein
MMTSAAWSSASCSTNSWPGSALSTDADRERVVNAMSGSGAGVDPAALADVLKVLASRWFVLRNVHYKPQMQLLQSRTTLSWLRGPMTRHDLKRLVLQAGTAENARS